MKEDYPFEGGERVEILISANPTSRWIDHSRIDILKLLSGASYCVGRKKEGGGSLGRNNKFVKQKQFGPVSVIKTNVLKNKC